MKAKLETFEISGLLNEIDSQENFYDKMHCLEKNLTKVNGYKEQVDDLLNETNRAKRSKIIFDDNFDIDDMFGKITSNCDEQFVNCKI